MRTETLQYKRLVRMAAVGDEIRHRLPAVAGKLLDVLSTGVGTVNDLTATLLSGKGRMKELAQLKKVLRSALRSELEAIRRTAGAVAVSRPDLDPTKFRVRGNGDQKLLAAARSAIRDLQPLVADFVAHAMPAKFLERLKTRLQEFEQNLAESAASERIVQDLKRKIRVTMRDAVLGAKRLDAAVHNALGNDGAVIATWEAASESRRSRRARRGAEKTGTAGTGAGKEVGGNGNRKPESPAPAGSAAPAPVDQRAQAAQPAKPVPEGGARAGSEAGAEAGSKEGPGGPESEAPAPASASFRATEGSGAIEVAGAGGPGHEETSGPGRSPGA